APARLLTDGLQRLLLPVVDLLLNFLPPLAILLTLERAREGRAQLFEQGLHVLLKLNAHPRRQAQRLRLVRLLEAVHVAPVVGDGPLAGGLAEELVEERALAGARRPHRVDVVALLLHADAEPDGA